MNLEEKAKEYANGTDQSNAEYVAEDYSSGYKQSVYDIMEFLRVNPKATHQAITEYLEGIV